MASGTERSEVSKAVGSGRVVDLRELVSTPEKVERKADYITQASRGDRQAFDVLHQHCVQPIVAFFRRHPLCSEMAEDLTQDVFLRAWEKRKEYRPGTPAVPYFLGFARVILKETRGKLYAKRKMDADYPLDGIIDARQASPQHQAELKEQTQTLRSLIDRLPEKQRQTLELTYLEDLTCQEASERLCCSEITVRRNRHVGLTKIQAWLRARD